MRNPRGIASFAGSNAEPLIACVAIGPCREIGAGDNLFITDQLADERGFLHARTLAAPGEDALLLFGKANGENIGHV